MSTYTKIGKVSINGKKKIVYKKDGSAKQYVVYKGKHVGLLKYKKMMNNKKMKGGKKNSRNQQRNNKYNQLRRRLLKLRYGGYDVNSVDPVADSSGLFSNVSSSLSGASQDISNGLFGSSQGLLGVSGPTKGGRCRKVKKCKKVKSGKGKGKRVCRKACK